VTPRRAAALLVLPVLAAGCGATRSASTTTGATTAPPPTAAPAPQETVVAAYFLRDGKVAPVAVHVPHTGAVATAALAALLDGPPEGYASDVPEVEGATVRVAAGTAVVTVPEALSDPTGAAAAQIVYTLTRFPTVSAVELRLADGTVVLPAATRADYEAETPTILVETPLPGEQVSSPLRVSGTASVFEATVRLELVRDGKTIAATTATAAEGAPGRGAFDAELPFTGTGEATLVAFSPNVGEGPPRLHEVDVPVDLAP